MNIPLASANLLRLAVIPFVAEKSRGLGRGSGAVYALKVVEASPHCLLYFGYYFFEIYEVSEIFRKF